MMARVRRSEANRRTIVKQRELDIVDKLKQQKLADDNRHLHTAEKEAWVRHHRRHYFLLCVSAVRCVTSHDLTSYLSYPSVFMTILGLQCDIIRNTVGSDMTAFSSTNYSSVGVESFMTLLFILHRFISAKTHYKL